MSSPDAPSKITRAPRTYGRRKPIQPSEVQGPFAQALTVDTSPSVSNTSPTNSVSLDDVPPSSDDLGFGDTSLNDDDDDSHDEGAQDAISDGMDDAAGPSKYVRRSLKDALAQIDEQFDNEDMDVEPTDTLEEKARLLSKGDASGLVSDDPFDGPPTKSAASSLVERGSTSPSRVVRRIAKKTRYLNDSDSESPADRLQSSPHSSPAALHPINTPNTQSSPTPPTSQDMNGASATRKGKERERSPSGEEDDSDGVLPTVRSGASRRKTRSGRNAKEKRVKAPSKKEILETQKATARIKADQRPTLPRRENKLRISSLFEKLSNGLRGPPAQVAPPEDPTTLHSDPIQPFSSSPARPAESFVPRPSSLRPRPSHGSSGISRPASREFISSGLLDSDGDEGESSSKVPHTPTKAHDDVFRSNGLLDGSPPPGDMSDGEELPTVAQIVNGMRKEEEQTEMQKKLREAKLQYIRKQQQVLDNDDDDSDLEVVNDDMHTVAKEEEKDRRTRKAKHIEESVGRQKQLIQAGKASLIRSPTKTSALRGDKRDFEILTAAAAPLFSESLSKVRKGKGRENARVNQKELNRALLHASDKQSRELTAQKEAEFAKKLGQRPEERPEVDKVNALETVIRRGLENRVKEDSSDGDDENEGDEENDSTWTPDAENEMDEDGEASEGMTDLPVATDDDVGPLDDDDEENDENIPRRIGRITARPRAVVDSDSDDDENRPPATGRILVAGSSVVLDPAAGLESTQPALNHRSSMSSIEEHLEEGTDKENDFRLMFDRGDDKENTAVASQSGSTVVSPLAALRGGSGIFSLPSLGRTTSMSSALGLNPTPAGEERAPLQELPTGDEDEDEDVFLTPSTKQTMNRPSTSKSPLLSQSLSPLQFRSSGKGKGLSSLFEDEDAAGESSTSSAPGFSLEPAADIRPGGLSQFFAASGQSASASPAPLQLGKPLGFSQFMTPSKPAGPSGSTSSDLALSLGQSLQPALEVDENLLRQADNIFEKEQEFLVEEVARAPKSAAKPLFVNRHGFLTQTKPPSSPASPAFAIAGPSITRQPLSTIALSRMTEDEEDEDEEAEPRPRRLRRRSSTPEQLPGYRSSPSPSPAKPRNAFDLLVQKPTRIKAPLFEQKKRLEKNEFIEGEAEESDEDAGFGFGLPKKTDDEEELDGEDQDQVLEELVDDAHMDDDTLNEERVLEKVQEHRALDDAADEKIARDAAEGKMRIKRRNNLLDFDDDESDEESWEAKRARERMAKKRRIEGDTLEQIEKNPETRAFAAAYKVEDDENEFAHLDHEDTTLLIPDGAMVEDDEEGDSEEENEREVVDARALREQLQRVARGQETVETIDVNDINWLDADDDDDMDGSIRTKEVEVSSKQSLHAGPSNDMEWDFLQQRRGDMTSEDLARQQKWARSEGSTRNIGTGRASAVTGMKKSTKAGSGSMTSRRKGPVEHSAAASTQSAKKLAKAPSALSAVASRRARFAN